MVAIKKNFIKTTLTQKLFFIFLGILIALIILETGMRLGGPIILSIQEHRNRQSLKQKDTFRILCIGESTTMRYPFFLEEALNRRNIGIKFSVINKGRVGCNTTFILGQIELYLDEYHPDMIISMIGINDIGSYISDDMVYKNNTFFSSFRMYKLARLLLLHIRSKIKELRLIFLIKAKESMPKFIFKDTNLELERKLFLASNQEKKYLEIAIRFNLSPYEIYNMLGYLYRLSGYPPKAEEYYKKAIQLNPKNSEAYANLGILYKIVSNFSKAEEYIKKSIELDLNNDKLYLVIAHFYQTINKPGLAKEYYNKANRLRQQEYIPMTVNNYRYLKQILDKRNIQLVCVQYPMRSVDYLKKVFENNMEDIIFADNEKIFKDKVRQEGYDAYFTDMFGGDFGHCTEKGNRLLAENIANIIIKEYFKK